MYFKQFMLLPKEFSYLVITKGTWYTVSFYDLKKSETLYYEVLNNNVDYFVSCLNWTI